MTAACSWPCFKSLVWSRKVDCENYGERGAGLALAARPVRVVVNRVVCTGVLYRTSICIEVAGTAPDGSMFFHFSIHCNRALP